LSHRSKEDDVDVLAGDVGRGEVGCSDAERRSEQRWPLRPRPFPDELLSSWLIRLAAAHGLKLHTFCSLAWPGKQIWNRDIDKSADSAFLADLAIRSGRTQAEVRATCLGAYEGVTFESGAANGKMRWVLPVGVYSRTRRLFGVQYCARCLAEDAEPHFRRAWRLAFVTECVRHRVPLKDRCPACGAPVVFHRGDMGHKGKRVADPMSSCHACGFDLRRGPSGQLSRTEPDPLLQLVSALEQGLLDRWTLVPGHGPVPTHLYLTGLRQIMCLAAGKRFGARMRAAAAERYGVPDWDRTGDSHQAEFEYLCREDRRRVLRLCAYLLSDWPTGFVEICTELKLWACDALGNLSPAPYWYWSVVHDHLERSFYSPTVEEIAWCIAKNDEVFGGLYFPPHKRIRFIPIWNAAGISVGPHRDALRRRAERASIIKSG
jgi:hypothetical protein